MSREVQVAAGIGLILVALGCSPSSGPAPEPGPAGHPPVRSPDEPVVVASGDRWPVSTPEQQGVDSERLASLLAEIRDRELALDCVLVLRNGHLVLEAYTYPSRAGVDHRIHSCTKSLTATLIGIAVDQGLIAGLDEPVLGFFPDREVANRTFEVERVQLGDSERWGTTFLFDEGRVSAVIRGKGSGLLGLYQGRRVTP